MKCYYNNTVVVNLSQRHTTIYSVESAVNLTNIDCVAQLFLILAE